MATVQPKVGEIWQVNERMDGVPGVLPGDTVEIVGLVNDTTLIIQAIWPDVVQFDQESGRIHKGQAPVNYTIELGILHACCTKGS